MTMPARLSDGVEARSASTLADPVLAELERVYRAEGGFVRRVMQRFGVPPQVIDDAVHDTFLIVARRLPEFEGRSSVRTWLFSIAMRVAQSVRRDRAREGARLEVLEYPHVERQRGDLSVEREQAELLHRLLDQLDDEQRAVFILMELEEMTAPEVAEAMGLRLPTVYSRLRLAREKLERAVTRLSREGGNPS
jgi:RNA polymerase sigma-70 factor (ECF subfamily)